MNVSQAIDVVLQAQGASGGKPLAITAISHVESVRYPRSLKQS
jgi:hypothetical protein